jgi:hypothetical protein
MNNNKFLMILDQSQIEILNKWIGKINENHFNEECEPPGFEITISFCGPYGQHATAKSGSSSIDLGEVECNPQPIGWRL